MSGHSTAEYNDIIHAPSVFRFVFISFHFKCKQTVDELSTVKHRAVSVCPRHFSFNFNRFAYINIYQKESKECLITCDTHQKQTKAQYN